jgi:hypothetical protein
MYHPLDGKRSEGRVLYAGLFHFDEDPFAPESCGGLSGRLRIVTIRKAPSERTSASDCSKG